VAEGEGLCDLYRATESFPETEIYGLTSQLRGAAVSVPSNIAEGQGRLTRGRFCHFLGGREARCLKVRRLLNGFIESIGLPKTGRDRTGKLVGSSEHSKLET
jgi:hypothetical protein